MKLTTWIWLFIAIGALLAYLAYQKGYFTTSGGYPSGTSNAWQQATDDLANFIDDTTNQTNTIGGV